MNLFALIAILGTMTYRMILALSVLVDIAYNI